jgi:hypothetical protein
MKNGVVGEGGAKKREGIQARGRRDLQEIQVIVVCLSVPSRPFGASVKPFLSCELKGVHRGNDPLAM